MQIVRRYFNGNVVIASVPSRADVPTFVIPVPLVTMHHHWFSPCLIEALFLDVRLHCLTSMLLLMSLLPISMKQSTNLIQLSTIP
jgi:hypothetical protein